MVIATVTRPNAQELYEDPLVQLWIPRLLGGHLADTLAWHRWGFAGLEPLVLLMIGVVVAIAGLLATRAGDRASRAARTTSAIALVVLILACAVPVPAPASVWVPAAPDPSSPPALDVAASGAYRDTARDEDRMVIWAQIVNAGGSVEATRIEYRVVPVDAPTGPGAWYGDIPWTPGERELSSFTWPIEAGVDPSAFRYQVLVVDEASGETLAATEARPFPVR
jgi:hypothetical protein